MNRTAMHARPLPTDWWTRSKVRLCSRQSRPARCRHAGALWRLLRARLPARHDSLLKDDRHPRVWPSALRRSATRATCAPCPDQGRSCGFLIHVLPKGFHRIRHYGLLANGNRTENVTKARELLASHAPSSEPGPDADEDEAPPPQQRPCPCCGGRMRIIEVFTPGQAPRHRATPILIRIDTS